MNLHTLDRQSFLGPNSPTVLNSTRIAIIGLGGGGSHIAQQLAHIGIGSFKLFDFDDFQDPNMNRNVGAWHTDLSTNPLKIDIAERTIKLINPSAAVSKYAARWQDDAFHIRDCDIIFGCLDDFQNRHELEILSRRFLIPYIDIGMEVRCIDESHSIAGQVILSLPGSLCMWCMGFLTNEILSKEAAGYGRIGARPQVIWPNGLLASIAVGMGMKLLTPWLERDRVSSSYLNYDGDRDLVFEDNRFRSISINCCPHHPVSDRGEPIWQAPVSS